MKHLLTKGVLSTANLMGGSPCDHDDFWEYREQIRKDFDFKDEIRNVANKELQRAISQWKNQTGNLQNSENPIVVTVHVRRGDYVGYLQWRNKGDVVGKPYLSKAFDFMMKR